MSSHTVLAKFYFYHMALHFFPNYLLNNQVFFSWLVWFCFLLKAKLMSWNKYSSNQSDILLFPSVHLWHPFSSHWTASLEITWPDPKSTLTPFSVHTNPFTLQMSLSNFKYDPSALATYVQTIQVFLWEKERMQIWVGGESERIWGVLGRGKHNQNIWHAKTMSNRKH